MAARPHAVVLDPDIAEAFPTSEAVNQALASLLAFADKIESIRAKPRKPVTLKDA